MAKPAVLCVMYDETALKLLQQGGSGSNSSGSSSQPARSENDENSSARSHGYTAKNSFAAAVLVEPSTALTAGHVVNNMALGSKVYLVRPCSGSADGQFKVLPCVLLAKHDDRDLAILRLDRPEQQGHCLRLYNGSEQLLDLELHLASYTLSLQKDLPWFDTGLGRVDAKGVKISACGMLLYGTEAFAGCSGSPLLNSDGAVVAIHIEQADGTEVGAKLG